MIKIRMIMMGFFLMISSFSLFAQGEPGFEDDVDDTPIAAGVPLVLLASAIYGLKLKSKNNDDKNEN